MTFYYSLILVEELERCYSTAFKKDASWALNHLFDQSARDIKHCVRVFVMERFKVSYWEVAKAEAFIRAKTPSYSSIQNSEKALEGLKTERPAFVREMKELVYE